MPPQVMIAKFVTRMPEIAGQFLPIHFVTFFTIPNIIKQLWILLSRRKCEKIHYLRIQYLSDLIIVIFTNSVYLLKYNRLNLHAHGKIQ